MQACGFQIIRTLREMKLIDRLGDFQFHKDNGFNEQVKRIIPGQTKPFETRATRRFHRPSQQIRPPAREALSGRSR